MTRETSKQVIPATKRAPLADRKQKRKDEAEDVGHADQVEPPSKRAKQTKPPFTDDKQKALRTIVLGSFFESQLEQVVKLASSAGEVKHVPEIL